MDWLVKLTDGLMDSIVRIVGMASIFIEYSYNRRLRKSKKLARKKEVFLPIRNEKSERLESN